jgi:hypothetical protein
MKKHSQPKGLEPGIYFGLPEDKYHADPALSHGGMVHLLVHPLEYWHNSPLNPDKPFKETDAMTFGKRCHSLLLEPENFFKEYAVQGGKNYSVKKKFITRSDFQNISDSIEMIKAVPDAYSFFSNGYPEVTIVWRDEETGIMLRIRIDWLRYFGGIDYKRSKNIENNPLGWVIADYGYDIQDVLYRSGIAAIKGLLCRGKVKAHGLHDSKWLKNFMDEEETLFCFLFQRSIRPYVFRILTFEKEILDIASVRVRDAINIYKIHIQQYGVVSWPAGNPKPEEFSIYNLPRRIFDQGIK